MQLAVPHTVGVHLFFTEPPPRVLSGPVFTVENFRFLDSITSQDLKLEQDFSSVLNRNQQQMDVLQLWRKHGLVQELLLRSSSLTVVQN